MQTNRALPTTLKGPLARPQGAPPPKGPFRGAGGCGGLWGRGSPHDSAHERTDLNVPVGHIRHMDLRIECL